MCKTQGSRVRTIIWRSNLERSSYLAGYWEVCDGVKDTCGKIGGRFLREMCKVAEGSRGREGEKLVSEAPVTWRFNPVQ